MLFSGSDKLSPCLQEAQAHTSRNWIINQNLIFTEGFWPKVHCVCRFPIQRPQVFCLHLPPQGLHLGLQTFRKKHNWEAETQRPQIKSSLLNDAKLEIGVEFSIIDLSFSNETITTPEMGVCICLIVAAHSFGGLEPISDCEEKNSRGGFRRCGGDIDGVLFRQTGVDWHADRLWGPDRSVLHLISHILPSLLLKPADPRVSRLLFHGLHVQAAKEETLKCFQTSAFWEKRHSRQRSSQRWIGYSEKCSNVHLFVFAQRIYSALTQSGGSSRVHWGS